MYIFEWILHLQMCIPILVQHIQHIQHIQYIQHIQHIQHNILFHMEKYYVDKLSNTM
jgi:hypothetical protein